MNKFKKHFYNKARKKMEQELLEDGLNIVDEDKFHKKVMKASRMDMIYTFILIILIVSLIIKWMVKIW